MWEHCGSTVRTLWEHCEENTVRTLSEHCEESTVGALWGEHCGERTVRRTLWGEHCASLALWQFLDFSLLAAGGGHTTWVQKLTNQAWEATCILLLAVVAKYQILRPSLVSQPTVCLSLFFPGSVLPWQMLHRVTLKYLPFPQTLSSLFCFTPLRSWNVSPFLDEISFPRLCPNVNKSLSFSKVSHGLTLINLKRLYKIWVVIRIFSKFQGI